MSNNSSIFDKSFLMKKSMMNIILKHKILSRTAVCAITGIRPSTISEISKELIDEGVLREAGDLAESADPAASRRDLMLNPAYCRMIGVDIQVNRVVAVLTDFCGQMLYSSSAPIREEFQQSDILRLVFDCIDQQLAAADGAKVLGIAISTIGILDRKTDTILLTFARSNWSHVRLRERISQQYPGLPVFIEDQVVCKLYAEKWLTPKRDESNAIFIDSGDILGCSIYFNGKILRNTQGISGEIGHFSIGEDHEICTCGNVDCLFLAASSGIIVRKVRKTLKNGTISVLNDMTGYDLSQLNISMILDAASRGDRVATNILTNAALYLGQAVAYVVNLLGPSQIILGGNLVAGSDLFTETMVEEAKRKSLCLIADYISFQRSSFPVYGGARGAVCMILEDFFKIPDYSF